MLSDTHIHTCFSADSETPVNLQIERAISLGMKQICITDHYDCGWLNAEGKEEYAADLVSYFPALREAREKYRGKIEVLIGIELGLMLRMKEKLQETVKSYAEDLDYVIGSSHYIEEMDPYDRAFFEMGPLAGSPDEKTREKERYLLYFRETCERLSALDCYDSCGHLDFVVRYGPNQDRYYSYESYADVIDPILEILIKKDKALEINTGAFHYGMKNPNPPEAVIRRYREMGGKLITVGSDAHVPGFVGDGFRRISELLRNCGFTEYCIYKKRKPVFLPLG